MITRDQAIIITTALTLLPNAHLSYQNDGQSSAWAYRWVIEYGDKGNLHSTYVGDTLENLALTLSASEWGGWKR